MDLRLVGGDEPFDDDNDSLDLDEDTPDEQEIHATLYRYVQFASHLPYIKLCLNTFKAGMESGIDKNVILICDLTDGMGIKISRSFFSEDHLAKSHYLTKEMQSMNAAVIKHVNLDDIKKKEPSLYSFITERMSGLFGYFPIVIAAFEGFSVFPWPAPLPGRTQTRLNIVPEGE